MNCRDATRVMSEEQERSLELGEQEGLHAHLAACPPCRRFRRQVAFLRESMRAYERAPEGDEREPSQ